MSGAENTNPATRNEIMNDIINHSDRAYDWRMVLLNAVRYAAGGVWRENPNL